MLWKCHTCGIEHDDLPDCFGLEAPWPALVPESEFDARVKMNRDQCIVDEEHFFVRGHIEIPIHGRESPFSFSVWTSLSEDSFWQMSDRWDAPDRDLDGPYFGWLCSSIPAYSSTLHLQLSVYPRRPGLTPLFTVESDDHPLAIEQQQGITEGRWHEIVHQLLHA